MGVHESATIRTVRFHDYGEPADVLGLDRVGVPDPGPDRIRFIVHACGLNPADWALCRELFPGVLPRGIGLELSGTVDTARPGVADVAAGIGPVRHRHRRPDCPDHRVPGPGTRSGAPGRAGPPDLRYPGGTAYGRR